MIIPWNKINDPDYAFGHGVFEGTVNPDPEGNWSSKIPEIKDLIQGITADPAMLEAASSSSGGTLQERTSRHIARLAMKDMIYGTQQTLGVVAQTTGIIGADLLAVNEICLADVPIVVKGLGVADVAFKSAPLQNALDSIGGIPIVGLAIRVAYGISKILAQVALANQEANDLAARRELAKKLTIPLGATDFSTAANNSVAQAFFGLVRGNNSDAIIRPAYGFGGSEGNFVAKGVYDDAIPGGGPGYGMAAGAIVHGSQPGVGFGYVPGSSSMTRSIFFPSGISSGKCATGAIRDMASLYPTAQNLCTGWWSQINKPGSSMFSVQPRASKDNWENYIEKMFALAKDIMKGWTCAPTGMPFTNQFRCIKEKRVYASKNWGLGMGSCSKDTASDWLTIPQEFGRAAHANFYEYLCQLYFGLSEPFDSSKGGLERLPRIGNSTYQSDVGYDFYQVDSLDLSKSVPVSALETLYANQKATLKSIQCMYISGEDDSYGNRDRFPAFNDSNLKSLWRASVLDVLGSNAWERVSFQDMPEGEVKTAFYQKAAAKGVEDVENFNRPCAPGEDPKYGCGIRGISKTHMLSAGPSFPNNPTLPSAPTMNGAVLQSTIARSFRKPGGSKKKSSNLPLLLGAGAIALLMMRGRK